MSTESYDNKVKELRRQRYLLNKEKEINRYKEWCLNNLEKHNRQRKLWRRKNADKVNRKRKIQREEHLKEWGNFFSDTGMDKCSICGYNKCTKALEFHHLEPCHKETSITNIVSRRKLTIDSILMVMDEIDKCIVVCANCHREIHAGII